MEIQSELIDDPVIRSSWLEHKIDPGTIDAAGTVAKIVKLRRATDPIFASEKNPRGEKYILVTDIGDTYLNWTSFKALRDVFGDNTKLWRGKTVSVTKKMQIVKGIERAVLYFEA